jgi:hypothetical protein
MGRCPQNRVVNFSAARTPVAGTLLDVVIQDATPHSLLAVPAAEAGEWALPLAEGR